MSATKFKILSVEDEPIIAARLKRLTANYFIDRPFEWYHVNTLDGADEILGKVSPDLILLDLNLYGEDGFKLLRRVVSYAAQTIIVSAYADRALEAFDLGVLDFVAKPFTEARLFKAFDRAVDREELPDVNAKFLCFRAGITTELLRVEEIIFIKAADKYTDVVTRSGDVKFHDKPLGTMMKLLPNYFFRIHKSFIVSLSNVISLNSLEGSQYELTLKNGTKLPVGRTRINQVRAALKSYI